MTGCFCAARLSSLGIIIHVMLVDENRLTCTYRGPKGSIHYILDVSNMNISETDEPVRCMRKDRLIWVDTTKKGSSNQVWTPIPTSEGGGFVTKCLDNRTEVKKLMTGFLSQGSIVRIRRKFTTDGYIFWMLKGKDGKLIVPEQSDLVKMEDDFKIVSQPKGSKPEGKWTRITFEDFLRANFVLRTPEQKKT